jgi:hypothetical protein
VAVTWKRGRRTRTASAGEVTKTNFIATCGTTLDGKSHKKKRWEVHTDGKLTHRTVDVKRLRIVDKYFDGGQTIDVHNHGRQGSLALESRRTTRWDWRFFQSFLGSSSWMHKRFCPHKADRDYTEFVLEFCSTTRSACAGVGDSAPVLRARPDSDSDNDGSSGRGDSDDDDCMRIRSRARHQVVGASRVLQPQGHRSTSAEVII